MKIAVFDHVGNFGGGSRFSRALLLALRKNFPDTHITFFGRRSSIAREDIYEEFAAAGIKVNYFSSLDPTKFTHKIICILLTVVNKFLKHLGLDSLFRNGIHKEIKILSHGYDLAFFPWPYLIECPSLNCPMVGVFHDFNFKYFFGSPIFSETQYHEINRQMIDWLEQAKPIVSSQFIASELAKFYPAVASKVEIVHLAPFTISHIKNSESHEIIKKLAINRPYILYPTNLCCHKNLGILFRAIFLLRQEEIKVTLVITGPNTKSVTGMVSANGIERSTTEYADVIGLGYVSNLQIDALIQNATAVISTSLYEAGNGPGLDAWSRGVPVIMSDIPAFSEHLSVLGVKAQLIDPYDAKDIAKKIQFVLTNYDQAKEGALQSLESLNNCTWEKVATQYHKIFCNLVQKYQQPISQRD